MKTAISVDVFLLSLPLTLAAWATVAVGLLSLSQGEWTPTSGASFAIWVALATGLTWLVAWSAQRSWREATRKAECETRAENGFASPTAAA